jgi:hypothetical protein
MSDDERLAPPVTTAQQTKAVAPPSDVGKGPVDEPEETITFDSSVDAAATDEAEPEKESLELLSSNEEDAPAPVVARAVAKRSESADFEMVGEENSGEVVEEGNIDDDDAPLEESNYELDELEAEIARELED